MDTSAENRTEVTYADNGLVEVEMIIWCFSQFVDELWAIDHN